MRAELISNLTTILSGTGIAVSAEIPFSSGPEPLYLKNMKRVYLGVEETFNEVAIPCLTAQDIMKRTTRVRAYLAVDAKNQPAGFSATHEAILSARDIPGLPRAYERFVDSTIEISGDAIIYTFEYRFIIIE